jgi:hypothetical protein
MTVWFGFQIATAPGMRRMWRCVVEAQRDVLPWKKAAFVVVWGAVGVVVW